MNRRHLAAALAGGVGAAIAGLASCSVHADGLAMVGAALAQAADPLGTSTPSVAERLVTGTISAVALVALFCGFVSLATGRHAIMGVVLMGLGVGLFAALRLGVMAAVFG